MLRSQCRFTRWCRKLLLLCTLAFSLLPAIPLHAQKLSPLAPPPDWSQLEQYQRTITRQDFTRLLEEVYAPKNAAAEFVKIHAGMVEVKRSTQPERWFTLHFAENSSTAKPVPRYWQPAAKAAVSATAEKPLAGLHIAIDPGHIGGKWAQMEERWFQINGSNPVMEGEMTLRVAELIAPKLRELGAEVSLVRNSLEPLTADRPEKLRQRAESELKRQGILLIREGYDGPNDPLKQNSIQWQSELLFYRVSEIRKRAAVVNQQLKPDLTLCLHFNAEAWGDPLQPSLTANNHLHLLINGNYSAGELAYEDIRFDMLRKLLSRSFDNELAISEKVAVALAAETGLPPYQYPGENARLVGRTPYVWTRNLLANRIYLEPYVMNSQEVFDHIQLGDYEGEKEVNGRLRKSIYHEYADGVVKGLQDYWRELLPR
jgi:hypothetical protein